MNTNQPAPSAIIGSNPRDQILPGDARQVIETIGRASVDCVITSPPYFRLRDYQQSAQIGLETSIDQWVGELREVFGSLAKVLKPTGSVWLNLGDSYSRSPSSGAPAKSLLLGPERLLIALVADGWTVRNKVIWAKRNPMPASVKDRLNTTFEYVYFLTRSPHYFFDLDAIRIPHQTLTPSGNRKPSKTGKRIAKEVTVTGSQAYPPVSQLPKRGKSVVGNNIGLRRMKQRGVSGHPRGKNPGDVWQLSTASYHGAHFATFPEDLVKTPLLATCPERTCRTCGIGWKPAGRDNQVQQLKPDCNCKHAGWQPGLVLDPFFGAGTVGLVAQAHQRSWLGIELNPGYIKLAEERIAAASTERTRDTGSAAA